MTRTRENIDTTDGPMPAHLWLPAAGSGPGILLLQEIFGVTSYIERRAQDLADLGYVVLAPELFWRLGVSRVDEGPKALDTAFGLLQQLDWPAAVADGVRALQDLRGRDEVTGRVGIVGFCFGGGLGFSVAAKSAPDALVSYYGSALPELLGGVDTDPVVTPVGAEAVTAPSLHHFGLQDQFVTRPVVEQSIAETEEPEHRLKKNLGALDLTVFGVGVIIGAGIFVYTGLVAATNAGPAIAISFAIAAAACALAALCYAEFASTVPVAGSAYTFSYATFGELVAWII